MSSNFDKKFLSVLCISMLLHAACGAPENKTVLPKLNEPCGAEGSLTYCPVTLRDGKPTEYFWNDEPFAYRFIVFNKTGKTLDCIYSCLATPLTFGIFPDRQKIGIEGGPSSVCAMAISQFKMAPGEVTLAVGRLNMTREDWYAEGADFPPDTDSMYPGAYTLATTSSMSCEGVEVVQPDWHFRVLDANDRN